MHFRTKKAKYQIWRQLIKRSQRLFNGILVPKLKRQYVTILYGFDINGSFYLSLEKIVGLRSCNRLTLLMKELTQWNKMKRQDVNEKSKCVLFQVKMKLTYSRWSRDDDEEEEKKSCRLAKALWWSWKTKEDIGKYKKDLTEMCRLKNEDEEERVCLMVLEGDLRLLKINEEDRMMSK